MKNEVKEILNILNNQGFEAYIIGGYPRDYLLGRDSNDYDICTNAKPNDIKLLFKEIITSNFGSTKIIYKNEKYEITTFRKDGEYLDNRRPVNVEYVDNLSDDLCRRDFTINTICMDKDSNIIDLLNGCKDLKNKLIKVVGDVEKKIKEDSLRILRAIRFATVLNFKLSDDLYYAIKKYGYLVKEISYERKKQELDKIFESTNVKYGIQLIKELELDTFLEINLDNIKITSLYGIWAQINSDKYKFTKQEMDIIRKINELKKLNVLDEYNLYKYGLSISLIVGQINNISKDDIITKYESLKIKNIKDIKYDFSNIKHDDKKQIIISIEKNILYDKLENNEQSIFEFIKKHI